MALQIKDKKLSKGIVAKNCYAKILSVRYFKHSPTEEDGPVVSVALYYDKGVRDKEDRDYIDVKDYLISDVKEETRKSHYEYLKTLDDFTGSLDV